MDDNNRRLIAFVAGKIMGNERATTVYDIVESRRVSFSGEVSERGVFLLDVERRCRIIGHVSSGTMLLSYGEHQIRISIDGDGRSFSGFDTDSQSAFHGSVAGRSVALFDDATNRDFVYEL